MPDLPTFTLAQAEQAIVAQLDANERASVDRIDRKRLDAMSERLTGWLGIARAKGGPDWAFNQNWHGPALADVLSDCRAIVDQSRIAA
jgi:hypothetical protein